MNLCRECAMMKEKGLFGIPKNVPDRLRVIYKGIEYYPQSYELGFNEDGTVKHTAIIHDLKINSICCVPLKDVKEKA